MKTLKEKRIIKRNQLKVTDDQIIEAIKIGVEETECCDIKGFCSAGDVKRGMEKILGRELECVEIVELFAELDWMAEDRKIARKTEGWGEGETIYYGVKKR